MHDDNFEATLTQHSITYPESDGDFLVTNARSGELEIVPHHPVVLC